MSSSAPAGAVGCRRAIEMRSTRVAALADFASMGLLRAPSRSLSAQCGTYPCAATSPYSAEGEGFEPSKRLTTLNGFRDSYVTV